MTWNYLAGFFDGEGHVRWDCGKDGCLKFTWHITQKNQEVLDEIEYFLIEYGLNPRRQPNKEKHCGCLILYRVSDIEFVCKRLLPKVIVKREQITGVLYMIKNRPRRGSWWARREDYEYGRRPLKNKRQRPLKYKKGGQFSDG